MIARIINLAEARVTVRGGVASTYSEAQKTYLRNLGMIATSPSWWFRYWLPIRWAMYPFTNIFVWWRKPLVD